MEKTMSTAAHERITDLLAISAQGDASVTEELWSVLYDELHRIARAQVAAEPSRRSLQPTTLVHEAYFRLFGGPEVQWTNRRHFFSAAAEAMRRIRIDDARKRNRLKRGSGRQPSAMADEPPIFDQNPIEVVAIGEALEELERQDARKAEVVKLRYFTGLTVDESAAVLNVSPRTVDKDWAFARAWLHRRLSGNDAPDM